MAKSSRSAATKTAPRLSGKRALETAPKGAEPKGSDTRERILLAAEDLLRRHGPAKTTVVDVARLLDMSHANVYRHFASKAELHDAVAERWLKKISRPLEEIVRGPGTAAERLERWTLALNAAKRIKVLKDPELFATYQAIVQAVRQVVDEHVAELQAQVLAILRDGVAKGEFKVKDLDAAAQAVLNATARFHHPHHVKEAGGRNQDAEIKAVLGLILAGLKSGTL